MARKQDTATREEWKAALLELVKEGDYLRTVVEEVVQQILEVEMRLRTQAWTKPWGPARASGRQAGGAIAVGTISGP
jgi:hypothetical protein